jgi:hypothetical protein
MWGSGVATYRQSATSSSTCQWGRSHRFAVLTYSQGQFQRDQCACRSADRLRSLDLEVWTNGTVKPEDAVAYAAKIFKDQLSIFINFQEGAEPAPEATVSEEQQKLNENLWKSVDDLELSVRSANCLAERQYSLHRRARAEDRIRHAQDQELRSQVAQGNQGNPVRHGTVLGHEAGRLAR